MSVTSSEIQERAQLIRKAIPNILEKLFEMSNHRCDLCGHAIQDICLAALDHSTPVIRFARSDMPIEEAIVQANNPMNLRCVHASCNSAKCVLTREEWFAQGLNNREAPQVLTDGQLLELSFRLGAGGRKCAENNTGVCGRSPEQMTTDGRKGGRSNAENKTGFCGRSPEKMSEDGRKGGSIGGRRNAESGQLASIASMGGRISGPRQGRKHAENKTGVCGQSPEKMSENGRKGARRLHELHPDLAAQNGRISAPIINHTRWHVNRGISNPECALCQVA